MSNFKNTQQKNKTHNYDINNFMDNIFCRCHPHFYRPDYRRCRFRTVGGMADTRPVT